MVEAVLNDAVRVQAKFEVPVTGLRFLGAGVAYRLEASDAVTFRESLARRWTEWLSPQDRQRIALHVTVQNKVAPDVARTLLATLERDFIPFAAQAEGVDLWEYQNGPWRFLRGFSFSA